LEIQERVNGKGCFDVASLLNNMGTVEENPKKAI